jgi:hypothetical protein
MRNSCQSIVNKSARATADKLIITLASQISLVENASVTIAIDPTKNKRLVAP